ncbi:MAG: ABC transporter substrate-binding protein [Gammaproteobacteria bacterium]|nr:ABC transporter substrate-binding protein [Gammaproteobacteria bacterium]
MYRRTFSTPHFFILIAIFFSFNLPLIVQSADDELQSKRILFIDSYHQEYAWSAGIVAGARSVLERKGIEMEVYSMDTKRNRDIEFIKKSALKAKEKIEIWKPDLVIAADDNASKYLIEPYFKNVELPIVFCGINWDVSVYGYPYDNATGMEEIQLIESLPKELARHAHGNRLGILSGKALSDQTNVKNFINKMGIVFNKKIFVDNSEQWREAYLLLQDEVDMLIIQNSMSVKNWNKDEMHQFIMSNTRIPTGTIQEVMIPYVLLGFVHVPEEQGEYAAKTAIRILQGETPNSIPIRQNQQVNLTVNLDLADQLDVLFDIDFLRNAESYRWKN